MVWLQENVMERKVILPVWHKIDESYIRQFSPTLADSIIEILELGDEEYTKLRSMALQKAKKYS